MKDVRPLNVNDISSCFCAGVIQTTAFPSLHLPFTTSGIENGQLKKYKSHSS